MIWTNHWKEQNTSIGNIDDLRFKLERMFGWMCQAKWHLLSEQDVSSTSAIDRVADKNKATRMLLFNAVSASFMVFLQSKQLEWSSWCRLYEKFTLSMVLWSFLSTRSASCVSLRYPSSSSKFFMWSMGTREHPRNMLTQFVFQSVVSTREIGSAVSPQQRVAKGLSLNNVTNSTPGGMLSTNSLSRSVVGLGWTGSTPEHSLDK